METSLAHSLTYLLPQFKIDSYEREVGNNLGSVHPNFELGIRVGVRALDLESCDGDEKLGQISTVANNEFPFVDGAFVSGVVH